MQRLTKSLEDKMLFGVCGGIAVFLGWDSTIVRILFVIVTILGIGTFALIYLALAVIMPKP